MATSKRFVIDTNVLISFLLFPQSVPGQAVTRALKTGVLIRSESTLSELARLLERPKFDHYLTRYERMVFLDRFIQDTVHVNTQPAILASCDVRDNKFLELTVAGQATCIITAIPICLTCIHSAASPSSHQRNSLSRQIPHKVVAFTGACSSHSQELRKHYADCK